MTRLMDLFDNMDAGWKKKLSAEFSEKCKKSDIDLWCPQSYSLDFRVPQSYRLGNHAGQVSNSEYFQKLCEFIDNEYDCGKGDINPTKKEDVFKALNMTPFSETKVVILGQDPYPNPKNACGLAFSVPGSVKKPPNSLEHVFRVLYEDLKRDGKKCTDRDWGKIKPVNGCLESWAQKGVLLLNAALTINVSKHKGSVKHTRLWKPFTTRILKVLNEKKDEPVVFLLWGDDAIETGHDAGLYDMLLMPRTVNFCQDTSVQRKRGDAHGAEAPVAYPCDGVNKRKNGRGNLILDASHPSNYSWMKKSEKASEAFRDCRHFHRTNEFLNEKIFTWPIPNE